MGRLHNLSTNPVIPIQIDIANCGNHILTFNQYFYPLPDQIDDMDYLSHFYESVSCCKNVTNYDKNSFTATANATWLPGYLSNPLDATNNGLNTVTIRDELRIPKGKQITIKDMTIKFAPGAKLIIEQGDGVLNGGRLILDNCKLTVDQQCSQTMLWEGIEVWGNANLEQGTLYNASQQGRLIIQNNTIIEHAKRAVILTAFDNTINTYVSAKAGGIVSAKNSTFLNNQRDIVVWNYISPLGINNLSAAINCDFINNAPLISGASPINHIELRGIKGVRILGCTFKHELNGASQTGNGIFATNSSFNADAQCTSLSIPCTSFDPNIFQNLRNGIYTTNSSSALTFSANRNEFIDCFYGIWANGTYLASITRNNFQVFESTNPLDKTTGIRMNSSTKYVIEENRFGITATSPNPNSLTYGIVINNSGTAANLVYKNNFQDLYIGGQSERINADPATNNATGLQWKCNTFKNPIASHDLAVVNGFISANQGYYDNSTAVIALKKAANNIFSQFGESTTLEHDYILSISQPLNYVYPTSTITIPDSYTSSLMTIQQAEVGTTAVQFNPVVGCPSLLGKGKLVLVGDLVNLTAHLNANLQLLDNGSSTSLSNLIATGSSGAKKNALMAASPYISDARLIEYILSNPPAGNLQQVLIANSPLSQTVLDALNQITLPVGVTNSILSAQTGVSGRSVLEQDIAYTNDLIYRNIDDQLREVLLDTTATRDFSDAITLLASRPEKIYQEMLLSLRLAQRNTTEASSLLTSVGTYGRTQEINAIRIDMENSTDPTTYLASNTMALSTLQDIALDSLYCICASRANSLLCELNGFNYNDAILDIVTYAAKSSLILNSKYDNQAINPTLVIYPNPSEGFVILQNNGLQGKVKVTNLQGQIVLEFTTTPESTVIDLSQMKAGVYLIQLLDANSKQVYTGSIVKK